KPARRVAGGGWRMGGRGYPACTPRASPSPSPSFPGCGQLPAAAGLDGYQRAQLVALLSQVSPRPRGAGSRDAAVQVNPRRDASVQCSLGRSRLPRGARDPGVPAGPGLGGAGGASPSPSPSAQPEQRRPPRPPRPPRTAAVYSAVASRRLSTCPHRPGGAEDEDGEGEGHGEGEGRSARKAPPRPAEEAGGGQADPDAEGPRSSPRSPEPATERPRFQFLEQKYGYYHCKDCNIRWESAYVWCVQGTNKVYFKQFCRTCQKSYNPYRVEDITCQSCKQTRCSCAVKLRHVDPKRPHRQDLCGRCKGKRLSCDSTFSFKYII
ncbi:zygote arrest protein 1, partial [Vulpes lagopus]|uniref:zygote arrest protein 1 n=1 Tax=Vulpes lagopus TaxID=494514 RepID=UPI001BC90CCF